MLDVRHADADDVRLSRTSPLFSHVALASSIHSVAQLAVASDMGMLCPHGSASHAGARRCFKCSDARSLIPPSRRGARASVSSPSLPSIRRLRRGNSSAREQSATQPSPFEMPARHSSPQDAAARCRRGRQTLCRWRRMRHGDGEGCRSICSVLGCVALRDTGTPRTADGARGATRQHAQRQGGSARQARARRRDGRGRMRCAAPWPACARDAAAEPAQTSRASPAAAG
jgi:hypothetical protein